MCIGGKAFGIRRISVVRSERTCLNIADRGNVAGVQRCVVGQGYYQVSTVVNAASFNSRRIQNRRAVQAPTESRRYLRTYPKI